MWNYDPRSPPQEFAGLSCDSFLVDRVGLNLCFLAKDMVTSGTRQSQRRLEDEAK